MDELNTKIWVDFSSLSFFLFFWHPISFMEWGDWGEALRGSSHCTACSLALLPGSCGFITSGSSGGLEKGLMGRVSNASPACKASPTCSWVWLVRPHSPNILPLSRNRWSLYSRCSSGSCLRMPSTMCFNRTWCWTLCLP